MTIVETITSLAQAGLGSLTSYLAAHVLLCLVPAFFIAGALSALIPKEAITRYLGRSTSKWISYPASALGGFVLAVCSCTIMPLFASIYAKGAGLGPAITILFVGPAIIGLLMAWIFRKEDAEHDAQTGRDAFSQKATVPTHTWVFFVLLLGVLIAGTLQVDVLTRTYTSFVLGGTEQAQAAASSTAAAGATSWALSFQSWLDRAVPANAALGIEGVSVHGVFLIGLLITIGATAWRGLGTVDEGYNKWTYVTLGVTTLTLLIASLAITPTSAGLEIGIRGKFLVELALLFGVWWMADRFFEEWEIQEWLWEVWRFVKQIMPLLLAGVFAAGIARGLIPAQLIQRLAGRNTVWANLAGVLFGVVMYFPTLVEVPIAQTFLSLGMQRGPLLAYLLADPELSVQSILITGSVIGKKKTAVYVLLVSIFSTLAGLIFGWVGG